MIARWVAQAGRAVLPSTSRGGLSPRSGVSGAAARTTAPAAEPATSALRAVSPLDVAGICALVVVVGLLWARARHVWYWLDEGISLGLSSHSLERIPALLRQDGSPPLYYFALHLWSSLFGDAEAQTHLLSLVFALATIPAALWAGWSLFGRRAGWTCALLAAVSPFIAAHANETRMYSLVVLLALLATATFLHAFVYRRRRYVPAFALSLVLLVYTHNWGLFFGLGAGVALAVCWVHSGDRKSLAVDAALAFGSTALLYAPWVPTLLSQRTHTGLPSVGGPTLELVRNDLAGLLGGREVWVALGLGAGLGLANVVRRPWNRTAIAVMATTAIVVVTVTAGWYASRSGSVWTFRYLAVAVPPILMVAAAGLAHGGRMAFAALALAVFLAAPVGEKGPPYQKSNMRGLAARVTPHLRAGDLVVSPTGEVPLLNHYLPGGLRFTTTSGPVRDTRVADWRDSTERLRRNDPKATLLPSIAALPAGARLLVVCPQIAIHPNQTVFTRLNLRRCDEVKRLALADARLRLEMVVRAPHGVRNTPVDGHLFVKQVPAG